LLKAGGGSYSEGPSICEEFFIFKSSPRSIFIFARSENGFYAGAGAGAGVGAGAGAWTTTCTGVGSGAFPALLFLLKVNFFFFAGASSLFACFY
jgi:hypothetical protein